MKITLLASIVVTFSTMTTVALAAGFSPDGFAALPWWEIALVLFPVLGIALARTTGDDG